MKKYISILFSITIFFSNVAFAQPPENVSIIELIANPEKFDAHRVQLVVYLNLEFEGDAIYLHKEDFLHGLTRNGLFLHLNDALYEKGKKLSGRYVIIVGVFDSKSRGHGGLYSGSLTQIERLDPWGRGS